MSFPWTLESLLTRLLVVSPPGDTYVWAWCRGRNRGERRLGEEQGQGGAGWGGMGQLRTSLIELELELIQPHLTQKPLVRGDMDARVKTGHAWVV